MTRAWPIVALVALVAAGCAARSENLLEDPGSEEGAAAWTWLDWSDAWQGPFVVEEGDAHGGARALVTRLEPDLTRDVSIVGAVQDVASARAGGALPERLAGHYRVDHWSPGTDKTYLQVVLGVTRDGPVGACERVGRSPCQVAWVLGGIDAAPFEIRNRQFIFVDTAEPEVGSWRSFDIRPRVDFERVWGEAPSAFDGITLYLEVRNEYPADLPPSERAPVEAVVRWDDLYLGP